MFDKVIDFLISIIELFRFFYVIRQWERGVILRFGKWTGEVLQPGLHYIWPLAIDEVFSISILPTVTELEPQTIVTKDKQVIVVQALIKYEVIKPEVCLLEVDNEQDAVKEFTQGALHTVITDVDYETADVRDIETRVKTIARKEINQWGIKIHSVVIKSFGKMLSIRLIQ
jgi:membrane protease subunit HflK